MVKIIPFSNNFLQKYDSAFCWVLNNLNVIDGKYYQFLDGDVEKLLYRYNNVFYIFEIEEDYLYIESFYVDENYNIYELDCGDYTIDLTGDVPRFVNNETGIMSSLVVLPRKDGNDIDGYNGLLSYIQYSPDKDIRSLITYQYMYKENMENKVYQFNFKDPFQISLETKVSKRDKGNKLAGAYNSYIVRKSEPNDICYDLMVIKDYGIKEFLEKGSYHLTWGEELKRYYKIVGKSPGNYAITLFPLCTQYRLEDLYSMLESVGHDTVVPEFVRELFNGEYSDIKSYIELAHLMKDIEKENIEPLRFTLGKEGE